MALKAKKNVKINQREYQAIQAIDGRHPLQSSTHGTHLMYRVRARKNGSILYFNFDLAREMGLIAQDHPDKLNADLKAVLLDTFAIQIINEYDLTHSSFSHGENEKPNPYMVTRYLQLQHPNKIGMTSGDGRSLWNGYHVGGGKVWDITSCGTGATCLSPATAIQKKFFKTGDPSVSYGCGYADITEGIESAIMSDILHLNQIKTERTLMVIEFKNRQAINVRVGTNLLRPSHFFNHLRQGRKDRLKSMVDFFIAREKLNNVFPKLLTTGEKKYGDFLHYVADSFADAAAKFESEYIFCWMDWDGDNILVDGGIIDYGSVRQFGLLHHQYRYDDVDRWSTNVLEQKSKARRIVQTFAQMCDYLQTGVKKPIGKFASHPVLRRFNDRFKYRKSLHLLHKMGFTSLESKKILLSCRAELQKFAQIFSFFERQISERGEIKLKDGINANAIFNMRTFLAEIPKLLGEKDELPNQKQILALLATSFMSRADKKRFVRNPKLFANLCRNYLGLVQKSAHVLRKDSKQILASLRARSVVINKINRITGDAVIHAAGSIVHNRRRLKPDQIYRVIKSFVAQQNLDPERVLEATPRVRKNSGLRLLHQLEKIATDYCQGI